MNMKLPAYLQNDIDNLDDGAPGAGPQSVDFSEYMWMAEELEDFDRQVEEEFWEEAFMEACFEEMLKEEDEQWMHFSSDVNKININNNSSLSQKINLQPCSKLNPEAPEFVPHVARQT